MNPSRAAEAILEALKEPLVAALAAVLPRAPTEFLEPVVTLWASETASYLGRDVWSSRETALGAVWRRTNGAHFLSVQELWHVHGGRFPSGHLEDEVQSRMSQVFDPFPNVRTALQVADFRRTASSADMKRLARSKGRLLEEELARTFAKQHGTLQQRNSAACWRSDTLRTEGKEQMRRRPAGPVVDPGVFSVVGEVDGWLGPDTIVEFKMRMERIMDPPPPHDLLQLQTYLHMNDVPRAVYVQGLLGSGELHVKEFQRDRATWDSEVMPGLVRFVCDVRRLLRGEPEDAPIRHQVLSACEPPTNRPALQVVPACPLPSRPASPKAPPMAELPAPFVPRRAQSASPKSVRKKAAAPQTMEALSPYCTRGSAKRARKA